MNGYFLEELGNDGVLADGQTIIMILMDISAMVCDFSVPPLNHSLYQNQESNLGSG